MLIGPSTRAPGTMSFIRFSERRNVDLPQPDGPMSAVTWFGQDLEVDAFEDPMAAVVEVQAGHVDLGLTGGAGLGEGGWTSGSPARPVDPEGASLRATVTQTTSLLVSSM